MSTAVVAQAAAFGGQLYGWADWGGGPLSFVSTDDSGPLGLFGAAIGGKSIARETIFALRKEHLSPPSE